MSYRAFFFDIDWTLYDHGGKRYVPSGIEAVKKAKEAGVKCFLCTSRPYDSLKAFGALDLGIDWDGYVSSCGALAHAGGRYVRKKALKGQLIRRFDAVCAKLGLTYERVGISDAFLGRHYDRRVDLYHREFPDRMLEYRPYSGEETISLLLFADRRYDQVLKERCPHFYFERFAEYGVDVLGSPNKKGDGIRAVLDFLDIQKEEAAGFGDGRQDISMKEGLGTLVALGNGHEELKKAADIVTSPIDEDGLAKAVYRLLGI